MFGERAESAWAPGQAPRAQHQTHGGTWPYATNTGRALSEKRTKQVILSQNASDALACNLRAACALESCLAVLALIGASVRAQRTIPLRHRFIHSMDWLRVSGHSTHESVGAPSGLMRKACSYVTSGGSSRNEHCARQGASEGDEGVSE